MSSCESGLVGIGWQLLGQLCLDALLLIELDYSHPSGHGGQWVRGVRYGPRIGMHGAGGQRESEP